MNNQNSNQQEKTKKCKLCQSDIPLKAAKCPHCQGDLRNWPARHPIWTIILILILVFSVIGGTGDKKNPSTSDGANNLTDNQASSGSQNKTYKMKDTVTVGYFSYMVTKTETKNAIKTEYINKEADGIYKIIYLGLKNNDKEFRYADSNMFKLIDGQGRSFVTSIEGTSAFSMANGGNLDFFLKQANPGVQINGALVFDIPEDAKGLKLEVSGSFGSSEKAYIELE